MAQQTLVLVTAPAERPALREVLDRAGFSFHGVPHALFSARGQGLVVTQYASGKLVIQGEAPGLFAERYLGRAAPAPAAPAGVAEDRALIGSDECGKGDFFGPLVVVAVRLEPGQAEQLRRAGVVDSKRLSDASALRLGAGLRATLPHAIERLDPPRYNQLWAARRNLNELLADLHAGAIRALARPGIAVLVDQFAAEELMRSRLADLSIELRQSPRAESAMAVAAASVIARELFLTALAELSEQHAVDLHKGAGEPCDRAARRFVALHGFDKLGEVAKLHFKNAERLRAPRSP